MAIYAPTAQRALFPDCDCAYYPEYQDGCPSKSSNALRLAIYACAMASLADAECRQKTGEPRDRLLVDLQQAVQVFLDDASFPRAPDMDLLRAYVLLMLSGLIFFLYQSKTLDMLILAF